MPDYELRRDGEVAVLTITRPQRLNAITRDVLDGIETCVNDLPGQGVRALIVTAQGEKAFCAGTDLAEMRDMPDDAVLTKSRRARDLLVRLQRSRLLSVAAINGLAFGGGMELALACTLRVAAPHASFSLPEIKLGVLPAYGGTQFLTAVVGPAMATDLMLTGRTLSASQALACGLVSRISASSGSLFDEAQALAAQVLAFSQPAIDQIRRCVEAAGATVTDAGLAVEDDAVRRCMVSDDAREGVAAFLEKRPPKFTHR